MGLKASCCIPNQFFGCQPANTLQKATFNLTHINGRIDRFSNIMQQISAKQTIFTRQQIDNHFRHGRTIGKIIKGATMHPVFVPA